MLLSFIFRTYITEQNILSERVMIMANQKPTPTPVKDPNEKFMLYPTVLFNKKEEDSIKDGSSAVTTYTYMKGCIMGVCDKFSHPVVILQRKNNLQDCDNCVNCGKDENSALCGKGKYLRLESTLFYDRWAKICIKIREQDDKKQCCQRDEIIADFLLNNLNKTPKEKKTETIYFGNEKIELHISMAEDETSHMCIRYECPVSHYDEIAVNINVNGIEGVMIIGQLFFEDTPDDQIKEFQKKAKELGFKDNDIASLISSAKVDKKEKYLGLQDSEIESLVSNVKVEKNKFLVKGCKFSKTDGKKSQKVLSSGEMVKSVFSCVKNLETDLRQEYSYRIDNNIKNLQEKMIHNFNDCFSGCSTNQNNNISIVQKCEEKYNVLRDAFHSSLEIFCDATDTVTELYSFMPRGLFFNSPNVVGRIKTEHTCCDDIFTNFPLINDFDVFTEVGDGYFCICKKLDVAEEKCIKILIKITKIDEAINRIISGFLQSVSLYITELYAQYNGAQISEYTKMMRHEMGQLNEAILIRINTFQEAVRNQDEDYYTYSFLTECNQVIEDFKAHTHSTMLRCNSSRYFTQLPDVNKQLFYPYESFLYKWRYIYEKAAKYKNVDFNMESVQIFDLSRTRMYADKSMIEQVAYNLTNNAIKYSIPGTTISIDCKLNDRKDAYQLIVTNYGRALREEEINKIFDYGYRGSNNNEANGSGLGLYLSKEIAKAHGGSLTVEIEKVSDYDVSCLYLYSEMPEKFQSPEIRDIIEEELNCLEQTDYFYEIKKPEFSNQSFTPYLIKRYLNTGTTKYRFILSVPYDKDLK